MWQCSDWVRLADGLKGQAQGPVREVILVQYRL
jgi:hypothetical protein